MTDFFISQNQSLKLNMPDDLLIVATFVDPYGEMVTTGTFLYGSGKMGFGSQNNNSILQDRLFHAFAPLARGDVMPERTTTPVTDFAVVFDLVRQGDRIKIIADQGGDISFQLKGQDMGFSEEVTLSVNRQSDGRVFRALHDFLSLSR